MPHYKNKTFVHYMSGAIKPIVRLCAISKGLSDHMTRGFYYDFSGDNFFIFREQTAKYYGKNEGTPTPRAINEIREGFVLSFQPIISVFLEYLIKKMHIYHFISKLTDKSPFQKLFLKSLMILGLFSSIS